MHAEGHTGIVHTAAASQLGQMLVMPAALPAPLHTPLRVSRGIEELVTKSLTAAGSTACSGQDLPCRRRPIGQCRPPPGAGPCPTSIRLHEA